MTDDALNLQIATLIEKKPDVPPPASHTATYSKEGAWVYDEFKPAGEEWIPRDFLRPAGWAMLLERLRSDNTIQIQMDALNGGFRVLPYPTGAGISIDGLPGGIQYFVNGESLGHAVCLAFVAVEKER